MQVLKTFHFASLCLCGNSLFCHAFLSGCEYSIILNYPLILIYRDCQSQKQQQEKLEMIKEMISDGMSDNQISKLTKVDIAEIQKIRHELKNNEI